jgi:TolB-like protein
MNLSSFLSATFTNILVRGSLYAAILVSLGGCAAGKMFMAGYKPPQTIADLLREQGKLPEVNGLRGNGVVGEEGVSNRSKNAISLEGYKGTLGQGINSESAMTAPPEANYLSPWVTSDVSFKPTYTHKSLQDYAAQLAMELLYNSQQLAVNDLIGVSSFVRLDESLRNSNVLGNQLAEYFIREIQQLGMPVADFKVKGSVDANRLAREMSMNHVLTGTLIEKPNGTQINARIVALSDKRIVSTASIIVPDFVSNSLVRNSTIYSMD